MYNSGTSYEKQMNQESNDYSDQCNNKFDVYSKNKSYDKHNI